MSLISVEDALALVLRHARPLEAEVVPLLDAYVSGRVLATALTATRPLPPFDMSAMDGYAVRAAHHRPGVWWPVTQHVAAGSPAALPLTGDGVARILTGAVLPDGADAVVLQEDVELDPERPRVRFAASPRPGEHVRRRASDVAEGAPLLSAGQTIGPGEVALLAAQGVLELPVHRRPRVAILSSGDELIEPSAGPPARGQTVNGNAWALALAVRDAGGVPQLGPIVPDAREATEAAVSLGVEADVLVTTGGVSVGDHDHMGPTLARRCGDTLGFWKVALKPGKPLLFGRAGDCAVFGLPGNPASALVTFELFVRPLLLALQGHARVRRRPVDAISAHPLPAGGQRAEYLRCTLTTDPHGALVADARRAQSSGALSSLAGADALLIRPIGAPAVEAGGAVRVMTLGVDHPAMRG